MTSSSCKAGGNDTGRAMVRNFDLGQVTVDSSDIGLQPIVGMSLGVGVAAAVALIWGSLASDPATDSPNRAGMNAAPLPVASEPAEAVRRSATSTRPAERSDRVRPTRQRMIFGGEDRQRTMVLDESARQGRLDPIRIVREPQASLLPADLGVARAVGAFVPRLKPRIRPAGVEVVKSFDPSAPRLVPAGIVAFAPIDDFTGGRETLFADYAEARARDRAERGYLTFVLNRGETLSETLVGLGASLDEVTGILEAAATVADLERLEAGAAVDYAFEPVMTGTHTESGAPRYDVALTRLRYRPDERTEVTAWRLPSGSYTARTEELELQRRFAATAGVIHNSLFATGHDNNVPKDVMQRFANLFLYDIDFARDIFAGDRFEIVYEAFYDDTGNFVYAGDIVFAGMTWRGNRNARGYYRFDAGDDVAHPFFDIDGDSARRLLMKTPIEGARVTSRFGKRRHPTLGYTKQHKGVDFGAPTGTPIMAAGDGKIVRAAMTGSFGHYVKIEHANGYATAYAHLSRYGKGIKSGTRVKQGQIIGYVGSTGRSTGPHLHYEVMRNDVVQNPMTLDVANGVTLDGELRTAFDQRVAFLDTIRVHPLTVASATER